MKIKTWCLSQWGQYVRLWRIMKKPSLDEFKMIAKVSAIGVLLLGFIGFLINMIMNLIK